MPKKPKTDEPKEISTDEKPYELRSTFDAKDLPEMRAVGVVKIEDRVSGYMPVILTIRGEKVVKVEMEEPNLHEIAVNMAKINFVHLFMGPEE